VSQSRSFCHGGACSMILHRSQSSPERVRIFRSRSRRLSRPPVRLPAHGQAGRGASLSGDVGCRTSVCCWHALSRLAPQATSMHAPEVRRLFDIAMRHAEDLRKILLRTVYRECDNAFGQALPEPRMSLSSRRQTSGWPSQGYVRELTPRWCLNLMAWPDTDVAPR